MKNFLKALLIAMAIFIIFGAGCILGSKIPEGRYILATSVTGIAAAFTLIGYAGHKKDVKIVSYDENSDDDK